MNTLRSRTRAPTFRPVLLSASILALAFAWSAAQAQVTEPPPEEEEEPVTSNESVGSPKTFADLDLNGDGALTLEEASIDAALSMKFDQADKDGNGQLDEEEYEASATEY